MALCGHFNELTERVKYERRKNDHKGHMPEAAVLFHLIGPEKRFRSPPLILRFQPKRKGRRASLWQSHIESRITGSCIRWPSCARSAADTATIFCVSQNQRTAAKPAGCRSGLYDAGAAHQHDVGRREPAAEAGELYKEGNLYVLDEPSAGLHGQDVKHLLKILQRLVEQGNRDGLTFVGTKEREEFPRYFSLKEAEGIGNSGVVLHYVKE